ncbi:uncharacterized protein LOC133825784 [Humulus lupulus]|uniref:uncharacterized protein LOC133825784 n=1 Tax=Humulus lupulus TaxID=3486 RepID=UPI002B413968|nr:uncharacterized protein LOC133825784 [Humulus lupulus]
MTRTARYDLEKFDGSGDFSLWKEKLMAVLIHQNLDEALEGEEKMARTSKPKKGRFYRFVMDPTRNLEQNLDEFNKLVLDLANARETISKEDQEITLLYSLLEAFKDLQTVIQFSRDTITMEDVLGVLKTKDFELSLKKGKKDEALIARVLKLTQNPMTQTNLHLRQCPTVTNAMLLENVRHIHLLKRNLISLGTLEDECLSYKSINGLLRVSKGSLIVMKVKEVDEETKKWHRRLGHISEQRLVELDKQGLLGSLKPVTLKFCEICVLGKQHRVKFSTRQHKSTRILEYLHVDVWGLSRTPTREGNRFFHSIVDDYSRKIKVLRTDNGLEFINDEFDVLCDASGILRHRTVIRTPQQNGVAEQKESQLFDAENEEKNRNNIGFEVDFIYVSNNKTHADQTTVQPYPTTSKSTDTDQGGTPQIEGYQLVRDRTKRIIKPPNRFAEADVVSYVLAAAKTVF